MNQITAPFTHEQVDALNQYQLGLTSVIGGHPFTCPERSGGVACSDSGERQMSRATHGEEGGDLGVLIATERGWVCLHCGYEQDWAWEGMARPSPPALESVLARALNQSPKEVLLQRADQAHQRYSQLRQMRAMGSEHTGEENEKTRRIWAATQAMLASINTRRLALQGVKARAGQPVQVDQLWQEFKLSRPDAGVPVLVLVQDKVSNPGHAGYGCDAWLEIRALSGSMFLFTGGEPTHWRTIPAPAAPLCEQAGRIQAGPDQARSF